MFKLFSGGRPDVTPAQLVAVLLGGIPVVCNLLAAFNVYHVSPEQQEALKEAVQWGGISAFGLVLGDAHLRSKRNEADATVKAAALAPATPPATTLPVDAGNTITAGDPAALIGAEAAGEDDDVPDDDLPSDEEEFASPPPDALNMPVQPSQVEGHEASGDAAALADEAAADKP